MQDWLLELGALSVRLTWLGDARSTVEDRLERWFSRYAVIGSGGLQANCRVVAVDSHGARCTEGGSHEPTEQPRGLACRATESRPITKAFFSPSHTDRPWSHRTSEFCETRAFADSQHQDWGSWVLSLDPRSPFDATRLYAALVAHANQVNACLGGVLVHSAAVVCGGRGLLFLGDSGAGKSTIAMLGLQVGAEVLGDDLNFLIPRSSEGFAMYGCPGTSAFFGPAAPRASTLEAVLLLEKGRSETLAQLCPMHTAGAVWKGVQQAAWNQRLSADLLRRVFKQACVIGRTVPGYLFRFTNGPSAWAFLGDSRLRMERDAIRLMGDSGQSADTYSCPLCARPSLREGMR